MNEADLENYSEFIRREKITQWFDRAMVYQQEFERMGNTWESEDVDGDYVHSVEIGLGERGMWVVLLVIWKRQD